MKIIPLAIPGVLRIEERVFHDERGSFAETYRQSVFDAAVGDRLFSSRITTPARRETS